MIKIFFHDNKPYKYRKIVFIICVQVTLPINVSYCTPNVITSSPLVEIEGVEVVVEVVRCVKYFFSYALYSDVKATLTSLAVIDRFAFKLPLIIIKGNTENIILNIILL